MISLDYKCYKNINLKKSGFNTLIYFFILLTIYSCETPDKSDNYSPKPLIHTTSFDWKTKDNSFKPFLFGYQLSLMESKEILKDSSKLHPLSIGRHSFFTLYEGFKSGDSSTIKLGREYLDFLVNYPYQKEEGNAIVYLYPFDHNELKSKKWWSAMANSTISLSFLLGYEMFGDTLYRNLAKKSMNGIIHSIKNGGSKINFDKTRPWYLEYASNDHVDSNSYFVLNGYLYTLLAIKTYYMVVGDSASHMAYKEGMKSYANLKESFYYSNDEWTYYMLNPLTIESPHYNLFDLLLLKSLNHLSKDSLITSEIRRRTIILKKQYPINLSFNKNQEEFLFSVIGPPHPYWLDLYPPIIEYYGTNDKLLLRKELTHPNDSLYSLRERAFNIDLFDKNQVKKIKVFCKYENQQLKLYEVNSSDLQIVKDSSYKELKSQLYFESKKATKKILFKVPAIANLNNELLKKTVELRHNSLINLKEFQFFGINVNSSYPLSSLRIELIDNDGKSAHRYYVLPKADTTNFILLNRMGFKNYENINSKQIESIKLHLFYDVGKVEGKSVQIKLSNLYLFENSKQLKTYFDQNKFHFPLEGVKL